MSLARGAHLFFLFLVAGTGCADLTYRNLQLGQSREKYDGALPAESSRRTDLGLCQYRKDGLGQTDAMVVLLSPDRLIAAKIRVTTVRRDYGLGQENGYKLVGELDPRIYNTESTGPIDTLRSVVLALAEYRGEKLASDAYGTVAGGLARLLLRWPGVEEIGLAKDRLDELLELAPAGGATRIGVAENGVLHFEYEQGVTRQAVK